MKQVKKSINLGLKTLTILAFVSIFMPFNMASAQYCGESGCNYIYGSSSSYNNYTNNPQPSIASISPSYANYGSGPKTVTITGNGFVPKSVARVNGADRNTTFIDSSHLLMQATSNDMYRSDGFFVTVWSPLPGGGFSNSVTFTVNKTASYNTNNSSNYNSNSTNNNYSNSTTNNTSENDNINSTSNLASTAIFGVNGFLPSGLIQWIIFIIIVLIIVILVRKIFGGRKRYLETPLKHE